MGGSKITLLTCGCEGELIVSSEASLFRISNMPGAIKILYRSQQPCDLVISIPLF